MTTTGTASANAKAWSGALDLALNTRVSAAEADLDRLGKFRELDRKRVDLLKKKARLLQASERSEYFAEVLIACPEKREVNVELTYLVGGAGWAPAYEARADEQHGEVELSTFATVTQSTGEDWNDATITLSTALPRENATASAP